MIIILNAERTDLTKNHNLQDIRNDVIKTMLPLGYSFNPESLTVIDENNSIEQEILKSIDFSKVTHDL